MPDDFEDDGSAIRFHREAHERLRRYAIACKRNEMSRLDVFLKLLILATSVGIAILALAAIWRLVA